MAGQEMNEGVCPKCGNNGLDYDNGEMTDNAFRYYYTCPKCGFIGQEWYDLVFSGHTNNDGEEVEPDPKTP